MPMRFDFLSLFPDIFEAYCAHSILQKGRDAGFVSFFSHDIRDWSTDKHRTVDDAPYGGGAGMIIKVEPVTFCTEDVLKMVPIPRDKTRILLMSAKGSMFTQAKARQLAGDYERIIFVCGRYEGVDERVAHHVVDEEVSVGSYVLTGGELPAMIIADAVSRLVPGVLGNPDSLTQESHGDEIDGEYPQYTRPETFRGWNVPSVLLSGNHAAIDSWRREQCRRKS